MRRHWGHQDAGGWNEETEIEELPGIDSLKHTRLIAGIEERLNRKLEMAELMELETVADLKSLLAKSRD